MLLSSDLGLGPDEVGQKGLKQLHLWCHSKFFFTADMKICRIFWGFEQLFSTIVSGDIPMQTTGF